MREVSCRALGVLLKAAKQKRVRPATLTRGIPYDIGHLRDPKQRIEWEAFCQVLANSRAVWSLEQLSDLNEDLMLSPYLAPFSVVARMLFTSRDLFDWICKRGVGGGAQLFSNCVFATYHHVGEETTVIELEIQEPFRRSDEFFWMTRGAFIAMPRLVGSGNAVVDMTIEERRAVYRVKYRNKRGTMSSAVRLASLPFTMRTAARELKQAHEELQARYLELEQANEALEQYRTTLERKVEERTVELRRVVEQLREAQGARERFFGNISHEIRTPLAVIMLTASHIETRLKRTLDERTRHGLHSIGDSTRKLVRLVDELLVLAAGQEGKLQIDRMPTDVAALLRDIVVAWTPAAELAGLELVTDLPPIEVANVDPVAFERIATNLVSNAVKYTPRGGRVTVQLANEGEHLRMSVVDTGIGFDEELASRLFGRFERGHGERARLDGTGLGLSLCKQLVEAHDGAIEALRRDVGSEIRVRVPRSQVANGADVVVRSSRRYTAIPRPAKLLASGARIGPTDKAPAGLVLVVEDDVQLADAMASVLADEFEVIVAHDGATALQLVGAHHPQLLVTDVDMPNLDGIELARRFRAKAGDRLAPIMMVSALANLETRLAGLEAGAIDYMIKPFEVRELLARVRAQFRMRELAVRLHRAEQMSSLGMLTSGLAHELRNPANGVINALPPLVRLLPKELLAETHPVAQLLDVLNGCAEQIGILSRQLLGVKNGGLELVLRPMPAREIANRAIQLSQALEHGVAIRADLPSRDVTILCAPPLLVQVLSNLLENAIYAAGRGGWVEVTARFVDERVQFLISDSGPGVPLAVRDRIFEPFFTTKPPGAGTGLGLSLAREIVKQHHGVLELREHGDPRRHAFVVEIPLHVQPHANGAADGTQLRERPT